MINITNSAVEQKTFTTALGPDKLFWCRVPPYKGPLHANTPDNQNHVLTQELYKLWYILELYRVSTFALKWTDKYVSTKSGQVHFHQSTVT